MTTNPSARQLQGRIWRDGAVVSDSVDDSRVVEALRDPHCLVWLDLAATDHRQLAALASEFGLPGTEVEDALAPHERAKVTRHGDHLFFVAYSAQLAEGDESTGRLVARRVSGFLLPTALVTIRDPEFDMAPAIESWDANSDLLRFGPRALVHGLLDAIVDGHFEVIQQLDDELESLEDDLFGDRPTGHQFTRNVFGVRKDLVHLRRVVLPMREVVNGLLRHGGRTDSELDSWYDDLYDHVLRAGEWTESLRDMITSVFETNLSLQDARLNTVMKKLAAWAAVIAVPTAVTGWFGQNVPYPGFGHVSGLIASISLIVLLAGLLYVVFRRKEWL